MKRLFVLVVGLAVVFFATSVLAQAKPEAPKAEAVKKEAPKPAPAPAPAPAKAAEMSATGKVVSISDTALKIERTVKGKAEAMDFVLEKAQADVKAGDNVRVSYVARDGKNVVTRLSRVVPKEPKKEAPAKEVKKDAPPAAPAIPPATPPAPAPAPAPAKK